MKRLWINSSLVSVEETEITVQRSYSDFDEYWSIVLRGPSVGSSLKAMPYDELTNLKDRMRKVLPFNSSGRITLSARANAIKGSVPG